MDDKISVIVPVYNSEKYLDNCINSICSSSFQNLEIILINDGSTDKSGQICKSYAEKDSRIIFINQVNQGVSKTRNNGIKKATGKYITFVDSDDYIDRDYFYKLYENQKFYMSDLVICSINQINNNSEIKYYAKSGKVDFNHIDEKSKILWKELNQFFLLYGPCNKIYKSNIIKSNNLCFPVDTSYGEDLLFNFSYLKFCKTISYTSETTYYYNQDNSNSLSHIYRENMFENGLRLNNCMKQFFVDKNLYDETSKKYLSRRIFDDAYNSLFSLFTSNCGLKSLQKYKRIKSIINNKQLVDAIKNAQIDDYSKFYTTLIKNKLSFAFFVVNSLRSLK